MNWFGPPDVGKLKNKHNVPGLVAALKHRDAHVRAQAAAALAELAAAHPGDDLAPAVAPLITALEDHTPGLARSAIAALSVIGSPALPALTSALRSPSPRTRAGAALALAGLPPGALVPAGLRMAVDPLVAQLGDPTPANRLAAAQALEHLGPALEPAPRGLLVQSFIQTLKDNAPEVRECAARGLGSLGQGQAIPALTSALEDPAAACRASASQALEALGWRPSSALETADDLVARQAWQQAAAGGAAAIPALARVAEGGDNALALAAIQALSQISAPAVIAPLVAALKSQDEQVRAAAAAALDAVRTPQALPPLLKAIHDPNREVRKAVIHALGHTGDPRAAEALASPLRSSDPDIAAAAARAMTGLGACAIPILVKLLGEADSQTSESIPAILGRIGSPAVTPLVEMLRESPPPINKLAAYALGEIGDARAVWPLLGVLPNPDMSIYAAQALGKIGDPRAVKPLLDVLKSHSEATQQAAALALGAIGDPQAVEPIISLLRSGERETRQAAANALLSMYRSKKLDVAQKRKILEQKDHIVERHADVTAHQDESKAGDWHTDHTTHEDRGIGLEFPSSMFR